LHSHSYTGNALACSAALAVLDIFADEDIIARNRELAACFNDILAHWLNVTTCATSAMWA
jgi:adenosylmethionine-8-amino-7-oxononanoate aminotransferase